jgi:hypothetical protein
MNILARILSHGFAIVVVLLLASVFIYRGELFPGMPMPAFLGLERQDTAEQAAVDEPEVTGTTDTASTPVTGDVQPSPAIEQPAGEATETTITAPESPAEAAPEPVASMPAPVADAPAAEPVPDAAADTPAAPAGEEQAPAAPAPTATEEPATGAEIPVPFPEGAAPAQPTASPDTTAADVAAYTGTGLPQTGSSAVAPTMPAATGTEPVAREAMDTPDDKPAAMEAIAEPPVPEAPPVDLQPEPPMPDTTGQASTPMETPAGKYTEEPASPAVPDVPSQAADVASADVTLIPVQTPAMETTVSPAPVKGDAPASDMLAAVAPPPSSGMAMPALDMTRPYHVLAAAREAYWLHDHQEAESLYRQLIALDPDNPDGYGELGNLYFTQGKWEEAASAYFEAGSRLARSGHIMEAENLLDVIRGLESPRANELADIITQSR